MRTAGPNWLRQVWVAAALVAVTGCGTSGPVAQSAHWSAEKNPPQPGEAAAIGQSIPDLSKLAAADSGDFETQRTGAEFADDLFLNRCSAEGDSAMLDPTWQPGIHNSLESAAYCVYRLRLYKSLEEAVTLTLDWEGYEPPEGSCWLGLPDWDQMHWDWQVLPETNEVELADPALYASNQDQCYAVVVLLDEFPRQLNSIGFGELTPPEPPAQYNLFDPMFDNVTYLTDMDGNVVHSWDAHRVPATCSYLLENGHLLRPGHVPGSIYDQAGGGGIIEEFDWDGNVVWSFTHSTETQLMHHDIQPMPNGNILAIVWERKTKEELVQAGRDPSTIPFVNRMDIDAIFEIHPLPEGGGDVVWEWHTWDHLIQDFDPEVDNYGVVADHPELININFPPVRNRDYTHFNSVSYNADLDQIAVTASGLSEIWIIDHSTTTAEAASHAGGSCGRGGDLIYRWGNPQAYGAGTDSDERLFAGHNVHWIAEGLLHAGCLMVFNNGGGRPEGNYSTIDEIITPLEPDGTYTLAEGEAYGPPEPSYSYIHDPPNDFYSWYISGAQRLPNDNLVICSGAQGYFFEVNPSGEVVWDYQNPYTLLGGYAVFRMTRLSEDYPGLANLQTE